jgi:hypothetical protein
MSTQEISSQASRNAQTRTQLDPDKKADECSPSMGKYTLEHMDPERSDPLPSAKKQTSSSSMAILAHRFRILKKQRPVFKDGVGYDSRKLIDSTKGRYSQY